MRVIFLDIDGVLNADNDFGGRKKPNPIVTNDYGIRYRGISRTKTKELKWIVNKTDAKIVLVSSWKRDYHAYLKNHTNRVGKYLHNKLKKVGLSIYDDTDNLAVGFHSYRGYEITTWLANQAEPVESWVVLDDEVFSDYKDSIRQNLILTSEYDGLTHELAKLAACKLLGLPDGSFDTEFEKLAKEMAGAIFPTIEEKELVIIKPDGPEKSIE